MSRTTKKKYVVEEVLNKYDLPTNEQNIVKVVRSCGNNLHEVVTAEGNQFLASMPPKFRKHIWIKRGDFIVVDPIEEGVKVKGEISRILLKDQIKYFKDEGVWPKGFSDPVSEETERRPSNSEDSVLVNTNRPVESGSEGESDGKEGSSDSEDDLFVNTNRPIVEFSSSSSESEDEGDK